MPTYAEVARLYLKATSIRDKPSTRFNKARVLEVDIIPVLGALPIDQIDRGILREFQSSMIGRMKPSTINQRLVTAQAVIRFAAEELELIAAPVKVRPLKAYSQHRSVPREVFEELLGKPLPDWYRLALLLAGDAGLRIGEILALRWSSIGTDSLLVRASSWNNEETAPKSHKHRRVPLSKRLREALDAMPKAAPSDHVITRYRSGYGLLHAIKLGAELFGITTPISMHGMRHAFASELQRRGASLAQVRDLLGHSNISVTSTYLSTTGADLSSAVALLDPDGEK